VRTLSLRELNRATLARQLLLERRRLSANAVIERLVGMQAQWPPAPYVGIWSRVANFRRETLERSILAGEVIKPAVMRGTLHLVTARDYPMFFAAFSDMNTWFDGAHLEHALKIVPGMRALAEAGPVTMKEALKHMEDEHGHVDIEARRIFHAVRRRAHLLHGAETALWSSRPLAIYQAHPEPAAMDTLEARTELVRRYLAAFGPATRADIADWSGLRVVDFAAALDALEPLRRFREEDGKELLDLPRAPLPAADTPAPVRFLPKWDNLLLGHADRRRVISDEHRKVVVAKNGDVAPTFLVDGFVAGIWKAEKGRVLVEPFAPLPRSARHELDDEAARLEAWLGS
jgi:hypothetical protein